MSLINYAVFRIGIVRILLIPTVWCDRDDQSSLLISRMALLSLLHISITFNRCSLYLTLSPNVIDLGGKRGVQSFNRFAGIGWLT